MMRRIEQYTIVKDRFLDSESDEPLEDWDTAFVVKGSERKCHQTTTGLKVQAARAIGRGMLWLHDGTTHRSSVCCTVKTRAPELV